MEVKYNTRSTGVSADMGETAEALTDQNSLGNMVIASTITTTALIIGQLIHTGLEKAIYKEKDSEGMDISDSAHIKRDVRIKSPKHARELAREVQEWANDEEDRIAKEARKKKEKKGKKGEKEEKKTTKKKTTKKKKSTKKAA